MMPYLASMSPVIFAQLEKCYVECKLYITEQEKIQLYGKNECTPTFTKVSSQIKDLKRQFISISKIQGGEKRMDPL